MRRMYSKEQLERLAQEQAKAVKKDIATLVDSQGHDRFIEGDIEIKEIEGITKQYDKWSLSGSHLLIVLVIKIDDTTSLTDNQVLAETTLPEWIYNKLIGVVQNTLAYTSVVAYASNYTAQQFGARIQKSGSNKLQFIKNGNLTLTATRSARISFDFLIDNE